MLITSQARVVATDTPPGVDGADERTRRVDRGQTQHQPKCVRCYHLRSDVGSDPRHPELCARCVVNVEGPGEERQFA